MWLYIVESYTNFCFLDVPIYSFDFAQNVIANLNILQQSVTLRTHCQERWQLVDISFAGAMYTSDIQRFTFSSLFPLIGSNFTLMGSFLLLGIGGVGGVGVGETKFCKSRFGGGSVGGPCVVPSTCLVVGLSFLNVSWSWLGCNIVWTGDWSVWLWCNWCDFNKCAKKEYYTKCLYK